MEQDWLQASLAWGALLQSSAPHVGGCWGASTAPPGDSCLLGLGALLLAPLPIFTAFVVGWPGFWPVCSPIRAALLTTEWRCTRGPGPVLVDSLAVPLRLVGAAC